MTLKEFVGKYEGTGVDYDGRYGYQCVDLYRMYCHEVLKIPQSPGVSGAADIWNTYLKQHFDRIKNTPNGVPQPGDIVIWNRKMGGGFGHVAINIKAKIDSMEVFEQDGTIQSKARIKNYKYTHVLGWLRFKSDIINNDMGLDWLKTMYQERGIDLSKPESEIRAKVDEIFNHAKQYDSLEKRVKKLENDLAESRGDAAKWEELYLVSDKQVKELSGRLEQARKGNSQRDSEIEKLNLELKTVRGRVTDLELEIEELQKGGDNGMATNKQDKSVLKETVKEAFRIGLLAIIPIVIAYFTEVKYEWAGVVIVILRLLDKGLHEWGKQKDNQTLIKGLTRF